MDQTYIVAFACEDTSGEFHFVHLPEPMEYNSIQFAPSFIKADNTIIYLNWYQSITVCTEETLNLFKENLQIAI